MRCASPENVSCEPSSDDQDDAASAMMKAFDDASDGPEGVVHADAPARVARAAAAMRTWSDTSIADKGELQELIDAV
eukprot:m51a1_g6963 hypothetical protein (77) ;mRNA; f:84569-85903